MLLCVFVQAVLRFTTVLHYLTSFAVTGLLLGIPVLKNIDKKPWETVVFWIALIVYVLTVAFAILWNAFWPATGEPMHFPVTEWTSLAESLVIPYNCTRSYAP